MFVLISGLPRSGKTAFADALAALAGYTHVPLDRYISRAPEGISFLEWVASPACIDWRLLDDDISALMAGEERIAPDGWGPEWGVGGHQWRSEGSARPRLMKPSSIGYAVAGCYAFEMPWVDRFLRVFMSTPRSVVAERAVGRTLAGSEVEGVLDEHFSKNWRDIEAYSDEADLVISGVEPHESQVQMLLDARGDVPRWK